MIFAYIPSELNCTMIARVPVELFLRENRQIIMYLTQQNPNLTVYIILEMRVPLSSFIVTQQRNHNVLYMNHWSAIIIPLGPLLLTWFNFNLSMDK